ncbi:unnamed protein product [Peronospora destructor]|uniref:PH domain-containing protein n=1 Tax=Peronospora destructor TaxID=86335 RepID=A0AAV0TJV1_9STRA|nr:unnamed protein product [Peronospora destructor]
MKMRTCGLFWHKAIVSLKFITEHRHDQGLLTIFRPTAFGGKLEIRLRHGASSLTSISGKEVRRRQLQIRYGRWRQSVTLRAPTSVIFETWWAALENAFALPNFLAVPIVDARARQVTIAPVLPARRNATRSKQSAALEAVVEVEREDTSTDDMPMLEAKGPSSPTEIDILASWRTWGSQDHFVTSSSITSALAPYNVFQSTSNDNLAAYDCNDSDDSDDSDNSDKHSNYSDISESWSRPSEWANIDPQDNPDPSAVCNTHDPFDSEVPHDSPSQEEDAWLDEIARYALRQKLGATQSMEHHPSNHVTGQLNPLLRYAMS